MADIPPPPPPVPGRRPASIGARFVARLIDWLIGIAIFVPIWIAAAVIGQVSSALGVLFAIVGVIAGFAALVYIFAWGLGETGQTPGKRSQGVIVLSQTTGAPLGGPMGIGRELLNAVINSFCYIGYIWALIDPENQALYDKVISANAYETEKGSITPIFPGGNPF